MSKYIYSSVFKDDINNLILEKEQFVSQNTIIRYHEILKLFDLWCIKNDITSNDLNEEIISDWLILRETECKLTRAHRCSIIRELAKSMINRGKSAYIVPKKYYKAVNDHIVYIFSKNELSKFLKACNDIKPDSQYPFRRETYLLIFELLISTGARKSEILNLKVNDVDLENNLIKINRGKEYIDRIIPLTSDLSSALQKYKNNLLNYGNENSYFFSNIDIYKGNRIKVSKGSLKCIFRKCLKQANIEYKGIKEGPRIHDFRFTYITMTIEKFISENKDLNVYIPILSKFVGHSSLVDTLYYFRPKYETFERISNANNNIIPNILEVNFDE